MAERYGAATPPRRSTASRMPGNHKDAGVGTKSDTSDEWLKRAQVAFEASTTFYETNYRSVWEDNVRHYQSKHATGSKYLTDAYKFRSKHFRPKTRSMVRNNEAAIAGAFFSMLDTVSVEAYDEKDPIASVSAEMRQFLVNYRLNGYRQIPWFQICIGAAQAAQVIGVVCSKQWWEYRTKDVASREPVMIQGMHAIDEATGQPAYRDTTKKQTVRDRPQVTLYPIENVRFDPAADWTDVANSSPYLILMEPMRVADVKEQIKRGDFIAVDDNQLLVARNAVYDGVRRQRDGGDREDSTDPRYGQPLSDFDIVWVYENFMRIDGEEKHFYTLGTTVRLSEVRDLAEVYLHCEDGERPVVIGTCALEAHRAVPDSLVHITKPTQKETNEVSNTRLDNVKLVLQKRYLVRRGKQVDLQSLLRNAPGSPTLVTDIEKDVLPLEFNDVTGSSYQEQDRINADFDELAGSFSQGSVATNRRLNETVGGLQLAKGSSNSMTQYTIRVFSETWVEPVLCQLDKMEQHYESNVQLLGVMARKAEFEKKLGIPFEALDEQAIEAILMAPATLTVNVANSAMDPMLRLEQFINAMKVYAEMSQTLPPDVDRSEVKKVIFSLLGFRDVRRFESDEQANLPPEVMAQIQQLTQQLQELAAENQQLKGAHDIKAMESQARMEQQAHDSEVKNEIAIRESAQRMTIAERNARTKNALAIAEAEHEDARAEDQQDFEQVMDRHEQTLRHKVEMKKAARRPAAGK